MYTLKKSLGQHFLNDESISKKIVEILLQQHFDKLVEIGPGAGALTKYLLAIPGIDLKCVEVDDEKVLWLQQHYPALRDKIIHADFLEIEQPFAEPFAVIGNFPYNISTQIVFKILDWKDSVTCMIGMFQKEVAQRIAAKEGNKTYGILSVLVQAYFQVQYLFEVSEESFTPPPNVKSAVISFTPVQQQLPVKNERAFFVLVKTAFNQRRKMLRNGVKALFDEEVLQQDIFNRRAEQLSVQEFAALTFQMK